MKRTRVFPFMVDQMPELLQEIADARGAEATLLATLNAIRLMYTEATGFGIVAGFEVVQQVTPNMTIYVYDGIVHMADGSRKNTAATIAQAINAANATLPRKDIVYLDSTGAVKYLAGTAAASPSAPAKPAGGLMVAELTVPAAASTITQSMIVDRREWKRTGADADVVTALPTAQPSLRGKFLLVAGGTGVADGLYLCKKLANDTYTWALIN